MCVVHSKHRTAGEKRAPKICELCVSTCWARMRPNKYIKHKINKPTIRVDVVRGRGNRDHTNTERNSSNADAYSVWLLRQSRRLMLRPAGLRNEHVCGQNQTKRLFCFIEIHSNKFRKNWPTGSRMLKKIK